jgi:hypothetical protein
MAWATVADVTNLTGITPTAAQVTQAQGIIEIFAGATEEAIEFSSTNERLLTKAVAYQAAWITEHPDAFTNVDVTSWNQDGASSTLTHHNAGVLAPMAKRCIDRLSWRGTRSLRIRSRAENEGYPFDFNSRDSAAADDDREWTPYP